MSRVLLWRRLLRRWTLQLWQLSWVVLVTALPLQNTAAAPADGVQLDVEVLGLEAPLHDNVRLHLSIAQLQTPGSWNPFAESDPLPTLDVVRSEHARAESEIQAALMPFGHYRPRISTALVVDEQRVTARYQVDPGPATQLRQVEVRVRGPGAAHASVQAALELPRPRSGEPLVHSGYELLKQTLYDAAYEAGYLRAHWVTKRLQVSADRRWADILLLLDTGPRFYVGEVRVQQDILDPDYMARLVDGQLQSGEPFDVARLLDLQSALTLTNYFSEVDVSAPLEAADAEHRIPVTVNTREGRARKHSVGLGFGTDTGPRLKLGSEWRRLNKRGHRLRTDLHGSPIEQGLSLRYEVPIRQVQRDTFAISARALRDQTGDLDSEQFMVRAEQAVDWRGWRRTLHFTAERESFEFDSVEREISTLYYPGFRLSRERANDPRYATRGYGLHLDLRAGSRSLGSDVDFQRATLTARWLRGLGERTRVIAGAQLGALWSDEFARLPPSQRFFAGGDRSIRGYAFEDVAPRNAGGDVIGGRRMVAASVELERLLFGDYGVALFADAGDAFDDTPDLRVGAGLGLRWRSPVGMVRVDLAHPFDDEGTSVRVHVTIGATL